MQNGGFDAVNKRRTTFDFRTVLGSILTFAVVVSSIIKMFIETLEFTIPVELCTVFSTLQKGQRSNVEFPASVNSYGTTQDANIQVVLRSNKVTFKVDGVSSNASMISKSECKTLKLSVFDVDHSLMPQDEDDYNTNNLSPAHHSTPQTLGKRPHEESVSLPAAKSSRTSYSDSHRPKSPNHCRSHIQPSSHHQSEQLHSKSQSDNNFTQLQNERVNVKQEPEDPDLIEIEPDEMELKKETPFMQIDYSSSEPRIRTSQAALDRLSHPASSYSQSPASSSSSFHQNVPHVQDYAEPGTSQPHHGDQATDDYLVFQDDDGGGDDNEADYSNDDVAKESNAVHADVLNLSKHLPMDMFPVSSSLPFPPSLMMGGSFYGKKPWQCEECGKTFTNPWSKKLHKEALHQNVTYTCACGKVYKYPQNFKKHQKECFVAARANQEAPGQ